jgi:hypothetical protein
MVSVQNFPVVGKSRFHKRLGVTKLNSCLLTLKLFNSEDHNPIILTLN